MAQCRRLHPNLDAMRVERQWLAKRGGEQEAETPAQQLLQRQPCVTGGWPGCKREGPGLGLTERQHCLTHIASRQPQGKL